MDKRTERYKIAVINVSNFLLGQLELYKIEFSETSNNKYLKVMNELHGAYKLVLNMDYEIKRISKLNAKLRIENDKLKNKQI